MGVVASVMRLHLATGDGLSVPWCFGMALVVLGSVLLAQSLRGRSGAGAHGAAWRVMALGVALAVYLGALEPVGFPLATFGLVLFTTRVVAVQRWLLAAGASTLTSVGSYLLFAVWLGVPLPMGLLTP